MINNDTPLSPEATIKECTLINDQIWRELNSAYGITKDTQADCVDWFSNLYDAACVFKLQSCKVIDQLKIAKEALVDIAKERESDGNVRRNIRQDIALQAISQITL